MARVAAIDLGTNSTRLLAADISEGRIRDLERQTHVTRLGEGVDGRRRLLPLPIARVRNVLSDYRRIAETLGVERTLAIGTSAVRDAENGEAFLGEIEWSYGFSTRLLSGHDEALLTFRGVTADRALDAGTMIVDLGGGSTEPRSPRPSCPSPKKGPLRRAPTPAADPRRRSRCTRTPRGRRRSLRTSS